MRSSILTFAVVALLAAISPAIASAQGDVVVFFTGKDATGVSQSIPVGVFKVDGKQLGSNEASVKVAKEHNVRFCANPDGTGKCEEFAEGTHNLTSIDFNFIKVWKGAPTPAAGAAVVPASNAPAASGAQRRF